MDDQPPPELTIERFAELAALVDDGRVVRASILDSAGLDELAWAHLERHWMARLAAGDDTDLAARFGTAFGRTKYSLPTPSGEARGAPASKVDDTLPTGATPPGALRAEGAPVVDDTLVDPVAPAEASATNCTTAVAPHHAAVPVPVGDEAPGSGTDSPRSEPVDLTVECAPDASARLVLPFVAPQREEREAPPGRRWAYYDTQTGQALATPVLVTVPEGAHQ